MELPVHELMLSVREALAIWLGLVALAATAMALMSALAWSGRGGRAPRPARARREPATAARTQPRRTRLARQAQELSGYAEEIAVAAGGATKTARRRREEWLASLRVVDAAWRAYEVADAAARRVERAAAFRVPAVSLTADELTSRDRHLRRVATEAYRRGELSMQQLTDVLCHRDGWDPGLHPIEQEQRLRQIGRERRLHAYRAASTVERAAWQAADVAAAAERSLADERLTATLQAHQAQRQLADARPQRRWRAALTGRPSLAVR